jgi:hypothetical protein
MKIAFQFGQKQIVYQSGLSDSESMLSNFQ